MRELAAAALLLLALVVGALAPKIWPESRESGALASGAPVAPPSWHGRDGGTGFVVCGSSDTWTRPALAEQNAHLAADPRYARLRADDSYSDAWLPFRAGASLYDGSGLSARIDLIALTGMWSDPKIAAVASSCTSKEPQVWLVGYTPATYFANDSTMGELRVVPAPGYRMVVLTGVIRRELVVVSAMKLGFFQMPASAITPTPIPLPKPTLAATRSPEPPSPFPATDRPVDFTLPSPCEVQISSRHADGLGASWTVQCGSAEANLGVAVAAMRQGWTHVSGPPIGVGMQTYVKGALSMRIAYRLDGPAYSDPFPLAQYSRPIAQGAEASPPNPNAYVRVPTGFELPTGCVWGEAPAGFTSDGAYKIPFACPLIEADQIQATFTRAMQTQGWRIENGGFGFLTYSRDDLRLTATFANEKAEPSDTPWVVESLCCFAP
jgi:hypothetical protein